MTPSLRRSFIIHDDDAAASTSTPAPAKVGIVISHGRAMTLQDKLQMTTGFSPSLSSTSSLPGQRTSPSADATSTPAAAALRRPLHDHNRQSTSTPVAPPPHRKPAKRRSSKSVVKRSLMSTPKVTYILDLSFTPLKSVHTTHSSVCCRTSSVFTSSIRPFCVETVSYTHLTLPTIYSV